MIKGNGSVYVCGSRGLKDGVVEKLRKIFDERNMVEYLDEMVRDGRIFFEVFG